MGGASKLSRVKDNMQFKESIFKKPIPDFVMGQGEEES